MCVLNSPISSRAFQGRSETNKQTTQKIKNPTGRPEQATEELNEGVTGRNSVKNIALKLIVRSIWIESTTSANEPTDMVTLLMLILRYRPYLKRERHFCLI